MSKYFLYPQKPKQIFDVNLVPDNYNVQIKKNGWRTEIETSNNQVKLYSREGSKLSRGNENNFNFIKDVFPQPFSLDGELLGTRQTGNNLNCIVIWDVPILNSEDLTKLRYIDRYNKLLKFVNKKIKFINDDKKFGTYLIDEYKGFGIYLCINYKKEEWIKLWDKIIDEHNTKISKLAINEGLVFKNPNADNLWSTSKTIEHINQLKLKVE